jgi:hypothetical protein
MAASARKGKSLVVAISENSLPRACETTATTSDGVRSDHQLRTHDECSVRVSTESARLGDKTATSSSSKQHHSSAAEVVTPHPADGGKSCVSHIQPLQGDAKPTARRPSASSSRSRNSSVRSRNARDHRSESHRVTGVKRRGSASGSKASQPNTSTTTTTPTTMGTTGAHQGHHHTEYSAREFDRLDASLRSAMLSERRRADMWHEVVGPDATYATINKLSSRVSKVYPLLSHAAALKRAFNQITQEEDEDSSSRLTQSRFPEYVTHHTHAHSLARSIARSITLPSASLARSLTHSPSHSLTRLLTRIPEYVTHTHSLTRSLTRLLAHSLASTSSSHHDPHSKHHVGVVTVVVVLTQCLIFCHRFILSLSSPLGLITLSSPQVLTLFFATCVHSLYWPTTGTCSS